MPRPSHPLLRAPGEAVLLLAVSALAFAPSLRAASRLPIAPQDEGVVLTYPGLLLKGAVPNRSFESVYGPTWIWTMAGAFVTFGHSMLVERVVGMGYRLLMVFGVYLLLRTQSRVAALCSALLTGLVAQAAFPFPAALPVFGAMGFALLALAAGSAAREHDTVRLAAVAGACAGLSLGFRPDAALPLGVATIVVCLGWRRRQVQVALLWLVVALLPVWVNLVRAGPRSVVRRELLDPVLVFPAGRHLPLSGLETAVAVVALGTTVTAAVACAVAWHGARHGSAADRRLLALGAFSVALFPYMSSRWDTPHVGLGVMTSIAVAPALLQRCLGREMHIPWPARVLGGALAVVALISCVRAFDDTYTLILDAARGRTPAYRVAHEGRTVTVATAADQRNLQLVLADAERAGASAGRRLAVLPGDPAVAFYNDTFLYYLLPHFTPSTYYLEMEPGIANAASSRLGDDLRRTDVVITNARYSRSGEPNDSGKPGSDRARRVLASDFRLLSQHGPWKVLVRRSSS
jgi:hypothetical protein